MTHPASGPDSLTEAQKNHPFGLRTVMDLFDVGPAAAITALGVALLLVLLSMAYFVRSAPPSEITISTGPEGSVFERHASRYAKILEKNGVKLRVLRSKGSTENLQRLSDPASRVDVGFVQAGVSKEAPEGLVSLGSVSYQPLLVFYRGKSLELLSGLAGRKVSIGPAGSGTRSVALAILAANGIAEGGTTRLLDWEGERAAKALLDGEIDAAFIMGESAPMGVLRSLMRSADVRLYSFKQAAAYARKLDYLNVLELPEGAIDLGANLPPQDVALVGPRVELIAAEGLHPALSDLLLEAATETHGRPGVFQKRGEFPSPQEHLIPISEDALRYYKSGKTLLFRYLPFWLASLIRRVLIAFVPTLVVLIPVLRSLPAFFRWRMSLRIRRQYRELLNLEQRYLRETDAGARERLRREFDRIERNVNGMRVRAAFANEFYGLRGHISYVRALVSSAPG